MRNGVLFIFAFFEQREQAKSPGRGERATTSHTHNTWQGRTGSLIADYDALHRGWWKLGLSFLRTLACFLYLHKRHDFLLLLLFPSLRVS